MSIFTNAETKKAFNVDAYCVFLGEKADQGFIKQITYWYSMWSHTRSEQWKGFLQVDLNNTDDESAVELLNSLQENADEQ